MLTSFADHAPIIGLLFFFGFFLCVMAWALNPRMKRTFQRYSEIPLKEDGHDRS